jgi:hypothetical protein
VGAFPYGRPVRKFFVGQGVGKKSVQPYKGPRRFGFYLPCGRSKVPSTGLYGDERLDGAVVAPLKIVTGSAVILRVCVDLYMWGVSASERLLATGGGSSYALLRYVSLGTGVVVLTEDPRRQFSGRPVETLLPLRKSRRVEVGDGSCNAIQRGTHKASYRFGGRRRSMHGNDVYTPIGACFSPRDLVPPRGIWIGVLT